MYINNVGSAGAVTNNPAKTGSKSDGGFAAVLNDRKKASETDLNSIFEAASEKYGVPVNLLKAVAKAESNFNPKATSGCGAMGIMQLMPGTAKALGVTDAYDARQNIMGGAAYLSQLLEEFGGDVKLTAAAYNAGPGNVSKYGGLPPFKETENYVAAVMKNYSDYSDGLLPDGSLILPASSANISPPTPVSDQDSGGALSPEFLSSMLKLGVELRFFGEIGDTEH